MSENSMTTQTREGPVFAGGERATVAVMLLCSCTITVGSGCDRGAPRPVDRSGVQTTEQFYSNGALKCRAEGKREPDGSWTLHGTAKEWHISGALVRENHYVNGVRQGTEIRWFIEPAGEISEILQYVNGVEEGPYIGCDEHGSIMKVGSMANGKMNGEWTYWYPVADRGGGHLMARFHCADGKHEGEWTAWHWNGAKEQEGNFHKGKEDGTWRYWNEDGSLDRTETWVDGECISP